MFAIASTCSGWPCLAGLECRPDVRPGPVVPGRFDQQSPGERRPGLGDRALCLALPGLVQRRCQPKPRADAWRLLKPRPVSAELEMDRERAQRVDRPETPQPRDRRPPPLIGREPGDLLGQLELAARERVNLGEQVQIDQLARRLVEVLARQPAAVILPSRSSASDRPGRDATTSSRSDAARSSDPAGT